MTRAGFLLLGKFVLADRGNPCTQCWCSLVDVLGEEGNYSIEILLKFVCVCHYFGICHGQCVIPDAIQQVSNLQCKMKALLLIFHKIAQDNMVLDILCNILFPVPCFLFPILCRHLYNQLGF